MSTNSFFNNSPTVVLPPTPDQYFVNNHYVDQQGNNASMFNGISPNGLANSNAFMSNASASTSAAQTPGSLAGRKRSRGDIFSQADEEDQEPDLEDGSRISPITEEIKKPRGKPIYGPGMTVVYPEDPGYSALAESQSGTWVEEKSERQPFQLAHLKRPSMTARKSQRMDSKAAGPDDLAQLVLPPNMREATQEPLIDEATRRLGIGWKRMDSSEALMINQKAYSKWILNHYQGLTEVEIWFENSSIPGYLVTARNSYGIQTYYIFSDDLTEARVVTTEPSQLLPRLQMLPALELAAPGGHMRAETDPITSAQNELDAALLNGAAESSSQRPNGCAGHAMELD